MSARVRRLLLVLLLATLTGDQWAVMQSAAWATMLVSSLRTDSFPHAVTSTFDGQHPCPLCRAIDQGKKSEKKADPLPNLTRHEFLPIERASALAGLDRFQFIPGESDRLCETLAKPPLTPPPRAFRA